MITDSFNDLFYLFPLLIILSTAGVGLLLGVLNQKWGEALFFSTANLGILSAVVVLIALIGQPAQTFLHQALIMDDMTHILSAAVLMLLWFGLWFVRHYLRQHQMIAIDFYLLILCSTLGMMIMIASNTLLMMYLGIELLSLPLYAMTAMRKTSGHAAEAAVKYFVLGGIASGFLLYGMSLLYGATGDLSLMGIAKHLHSQGVSSLFQYAIVFLLAGLAFKLASVPFHMWAPDVYEGAPTASVLFIGSIPKIATMALLVRLLHTGLGDLVAQWQPIMLVMALSSIAIGNVLAIVQTNIKRLFAYSGIAHMGYALLGIAAATPEGYMSALYYTLIYALMASSGFVVLVLLSRSTVDVETLEDLKGLNDRQPLLAAFMMLILFSMAGIPPTIGFLVKLSVLQALIHVQLLWVAVLALLFAVVGAFYYLRVVKVMYFEAPNTFEPIQSSKPLLLLLSIQSLSLLYFGILPSGLMDMCRLLIV